MSKEPPKFDEQEMQPHMLAINAADNKPKLTITNKGKLIIHGDTSEAALLLITAFASEIDRILETKTNKDFKTAKELLAVAVTEHDEHFGEACHPLHWTNKARTAGLV